MECKFNTQIKALIYKSVTLQLQYGNNEVTVMFENAKSQVVNPIDSTQSQLFDMIYFYFAFDFNFTY